jgi:hypothetical protein
MHRVRRCAPFGRADNSRGRGPHPADVRSRSRGGANTGRGTPHLSCCPRPSAGHVCLPPVRIGFRGQTSHCSRAILPAPPSVDPPTTRSPSANLAPSHTEATGANRAVHSGRRSTPAPVQEVVESRRYSRHSARRLPDISSPGRGFPFVQIRAIRLPPAHPWHLPVISSAPERHECIPAPENLRPSTSRRLEARNVSLTRRCPK